jgi:hypothetical protein
MVPSLYDVRDTCDICAVYWCGGWHSRHVASHELRLSITFASLDSSSRTTPTTGATSRPAGDPGTIEPANLVREALGPPASRFGRRPGGDGLRTALVAAVRRD